jgi:pyrroloquinoline quinone biosynthesis protein B
MAHCAALPESLAGEIADARLVFFDGTLFTDDEMIRQGVGKKTGRRMGHMSLDGPDGSLAKLAPLEVEAAGFEVAFDGMEVRL